MDSPQLSLRTPADVLAAVPYLLGFVPAKSVVVVGLRAKSVVFQVRVDLPAPECVDEFAKQVVGIVARQRVTRALIAGYGSEPAVTPAVLAVRSQLRRRRIDVPDALRVTDGRYWSYVCVDASCCDPAGTPFDVTTSVVAASATVAGINVLASREDLVARLSPVGGSAALAMRDAALRADHRLCDLLDARPAEASTETLIAAGRAAVDMAALRFAYRGMLDDDDVAWLGLVLVNVAVRDYAWERIGEDLPLHVELWTDVMRRVEPDLVAAPATLLAFAAWRQGEGAVASIALHRALTADQNYGMARLLSAALAGGMSPTEYMDLIEADESTATAPRPPRKLRPRRRSTRYRV
jgi:hypothetical protein